MAIYPFLLSLQIVIIFASFHDIAIINSRQNDGSIMIWEVLKYSVAVRWYELCSKKVCNRSYLIEFKVQGKINTNTGHMHTEGVFIMHPPPPSTTSSSPWKS